MKMRTVQEIVAHCKENKSFFGFDKEILVPYLPFADAKQFLKKDTTEADFTDGWKQREQDRDAVIKQMADYLDFAWEKAENHRGLSASRSVEKMETWLWLLGDDENLAKFQAAPFAMYGCPQLKIVAEAYKLPIPESDVIAKMLAGESCRPGCRDCGGG